MNDLKPVHMCMNAVRADHDCKWAICNKCKTQNDDEKERRIQGDFRKKGDCYVTVTMILVELNAVHWTINITIICANKPKISSTFVGMIANILLIFMIRVILLSHIKIRFFQMKFRFLHIVSCANWESRVWNDMQQITFQYDWYWFEEKAEQPSLCVHVLYHLQASVFFYI